MYALQGGVPAICGGLFKAINRDELSTRIIDKVLCEIPVEPIMLYSIIFGGEFIFSALVYTRVREEEQLVYW